MTRCNDREIRKLIEKIPYKWRHSISRKFPCAYVYTDDASHYWFTLSLPMTNNKVEWHVLRSKLQTQPPCSVHIYKIAKCVWFYEKSNLKSTQELHSDTKLSHNIISPSFPIYLNERYMCSLFVSRWIYPSEKINSLIFTDIFWNVRRTNSLLKGFKTIRKKK